MALGVSRSINFSQYFFFLLHCVPLYVCRLCINFQELCARLLGMATLRIRFSPSFHALLIDFLSIRKVIIFSAIATDDRHPLWSRSIHQNAANLLDDSFPLYCATAHRKYRLPRSCPHLIDHIFGARITLILLFASLFY